MPDQRRRVEAQRQPLLLQPPADVDVVAGDPELRVEAADRQQVGPAEGHVAAGDVLGLDVRHQHVHGSARGVGHAGGDRTLVGGRQVRAADRRVVATGERGARNRSQSRVGHGVVVDVGDDLADGGREAAVARGAEAAVLGADQAHVVAQRRSRRCCRSSRRRRRSPRSRGSRGLHSPSQAARRAWRRRCRCRRPPRRTAGRRGRARRRA